MMEFTDLEQAVIRQVLSKPLKGMDTLKRQFEAASVSKREYTGPGFFTTISVPEWLPPAPEDTDLNQQLFAGASATLKSDPGEFISFHVWTEKGYLASLEGIVLKGDSWPDERDIQVVESMLQK